MMSFTVFMLCVVCAYSVHHESWDYLSSVVTEHHEPLWTEPEYNHYDLAQPHDAESWLLDHIHQREDKPAPTRTHSSRTSTRKYAALPPPPPQVTNNSSTKSEPALL
eukprot:TRINITY_DN67460_c2_g1_i1.p1 TRINITY_DN67460_c2_g1~~TRINITY_DN67460_c2_g1_i1.p1  ORF type:complete len:107 (-),score=1.05 TRINITY_DN67460_c2_g1_i1:720-1040(-)